MATPGSSSDTPSRRLCGAMPVHRRLLNDSAAYREARNRIENAALAAEEGRLGFARVEVLHIPVVVHVVHHPDQPEQNVSDEQIASQMEALNQDFRATNPDHDVEVPDVWKPLVADTRIEFHLADTDPDGRPTDGVVRLETTVEGFGSDDAVKATATGGANPWPSDRYLNLWVCRLGGGLLGYAQFPGGPPETDGVVVTYTAFGTTGTARPPFDRGRTLTHEIGHWLNLWHIWGDDGSGCVGSDEVADTPNQAGENTGRPTFPKISCDNGPHGDMFVNYMDYTDDAGMVMFTPGQVARMDACLLEARASFLEAEAGAPAP